MRGPGVYLIHMDRKMHHAQHYIGYSEDIDSRLLKHWTGKGAKMLRAARRLGIRFDISFTWYGGTRELERQLKRQKNAHRLCPICNPKINKTYIELERPVSMEPLPF